VAFTRPVYGFHPPYGVSPVFGVRPLYGFGEDGFGPVPSGTFSTLVISPYTFAFDASTTVTVTVKDGTDTAIDGFGVSGLSAHLRRVSAIQSDVEVSPSGVVNDGLDSVTVTVTARDADGLPCAGIRPDAVVVAVSGTDHSVTQPTQPTDAFGRTTATVTSVAAVDDYTVSATVLDLPLDATAVLAVTDGMMFEPMFAALRWSVEVEETEEAPMVVTPLRLAWWARLWLAMRATGRRMWARVRR
jgi:hypothetical protein